MGGTLAKFRPSGRSPKRLSSKPRLAESTRYSRTSKPLVDPGSLPAASSTSTASGFAAQLASAQAAQPYAVSSGTLSPFTPCALPTSLGVSGVAGGTGLAGAAKMLAAAKAALGGATTRPTTTPCRTGLLRHDLEQPGPGNAGTSGSVFWANISSRGAAVASIKWTRAKSTRS